MIALHAKARNFQSSLQLYLEMQSAGFEPDKVMYNTVMEVLGHCDYLDEAEAVFAEMKQKNWFPDEPVYGLLVDLWGKLEHDWAGPEPVSSDLHSSPQLLHGGPNFFDMAFCWQLMTVSGHPAHTFLLSMPAPGPMGKTSGSTSATFST
ncbi:Pentatricopeptide repeat-containing protein [Striga hermonthica]|uniref:Pentatricopeptide repeat-containing protein n=1 Tax=Striga hermonthica TaxID=68872 RepID=A0A9N7N474_STRHE|nr:Pentatricopeptide repeat-containing protein [Striga hermonthica]